MSKICYKCKIEKAHAEFHKNGQRKNGLHSWCKKCSISNRLAHYKQNRAQARINNAELIKRNAEFVNKQKCNKPCTDCGVSYAPYVMDWDHLGKHSKVNSVSHMVRDALSLERLQVEIDKCELVCANCHRVRTHNRLNGSLV